MTTITNDDTLMRERFELSDHQLSQIHKAENLACLAEFPTEPYAWDHPLAKLNEEHRLEWVARSDVEARQARQEAAIERRAVLAAEKERVAAKRAEEQAAAKVAATAEPAGLTCQDCHGEIQRTGKRGRPPKRCEPCRIAFEAEAAGAASKPCGACARGGKGRHLNTCKNKGKKAA